MVVTCVFTSDMPLPSQDVVFMAKTLEKIFEQKLQMMPPEEYAIDPSQKGRKVKPAKKMKGERSP